MAEQTIPTRIKQKIDTTSNWTTRNPTLLDGEIGLERTTSGDIKIKIGDGTTAWNSLDYLVTESQGSGGTSAFVVDITATDQGNGELSFSSTKTYAQVVAAINNHQDIYLVYTDEDKAETIRKPVVFYNKDYNCFEFIVPIGLPIVHLDLGEENTYLINFFYWFSDETIELDEINLSELGGGIEPFYVAITGTEANGNMTFSANKSYAQLKTAIAQNQIILMSYTENGIVQNAQPTVHAMDELNYIGLTIPVNIPLTKAGAPNDMIQIVTFQFYSDGSIEQQILDLDNLGGGASYSAGDGIEIENNIIQSSYGKEKNEFTTLLDLSLDVTNPYAVLTQLDASLPDALIFLLQGTPVNATLGDSIKVIAAGESEPLIQGNLYDASTTFFDRLSGDAIATGPSAGPSYIWEATNKDSAALVQWQENAATASAIMFDQRNEIILALPRVKAQALADNGSLNISIQKQISTINKIPAIGVPIDDTLKIYGEDASTQIGLARRIGYTETDQISLYDKPIPGREFENNVYTHTLALNTEIPEDVAISMENELFSLEDQAFTTASITAPPLMNSETETRELGNRDAHAEEQMGDIVNQNPFVYSGIYGQVLGFSNDINITTLADSGALTLYSNGAEAKSFPLTRHYGSFEYTADLPSEAEKYIGMLNQMEQAGQLRVYMSNVENQDEIRRGLLLQTLSNLIFGESLVISDITQYSIPQIEKADPTLPACALALASPELGMSSVFTAATYFDEDITTYSDVFLDIFGTEAKGFVYNTSTSLTDILFNNETISKNDYSKPSFAVQLIDDVTLQILSDTDLTNTNLKIEATAEIEQKWRGEEIEVGSGLEVRNHKIDLPYGQEYMGKEIWCTFSSNSGEETKNMTGVYVDSNGTRVQKSNLPSQFKLNGFINVSYQAKNGRKYTKSVQLQSKYDSDNDRHLFVAEYNTEYTGSSDMMNLTNKLEPGFLIYVNQNDFYNSAQDWIHIQAYFVSPVPFDGFTIELFNWTTGLSKIPSNLVDVNVTTTSSITDGSNEIPTSDAVYEALANSGGQYGLVRQVNGYSPDNNGYISLPMVQATSAVNQGDTIYCPTGDAVYQFIENQKAKSISEGSTLMPTGDAVYQALSQAGKVKTVNNTQPDSNGNITLAFPTASTISNSDTGFVTGQLAYNTLGDYASVNYLRSSLSLYTPTLELKTYLGLSNYVLASNLTSTLTNYVLTSNLTSTLTNYVQTVNGVAPTNGAVSVPTVSSIASGSTSIPTAAAVYDLFQAFINEVIEEEY